MLGSISGRGARGGTPRRAPLEQYLLQPMAVRARVPAAGPAIMTRPVFACPRKLCRAATPRAVFSDLG